MNGRLNKKAILLVKTGVTSISAIALLGLSGCAAVGTAIQHNQLETNTKISSSIFLNPVSKSKKIVYVQTKNTSGKSGLSLSKEIKKDLMKGGYRITNFPSKAHYMIQTNIIKAGKTNEKGAQSILSSGYGGAISGGLIGLGAGALVGSSTGATVVGGLIGSTLGFAADHLIQNEMFVIVTDIQISEKSAKGHSFKSQTVSTTSQGSGAQQVTRSTGSSNWMHYRSRVVSTAEKVNLSFAEAKPVLKRNTAASISGLFINN